MEKRNLLPIAGLIILILGCLCGICAGISVAVAVIRSSDGSIPQSSEAPTLTSTNSQPSGETRTATRTPDGLAAPTATISSNGVLSGTLTPLPDLTISQGMTTTTSVTTTTQIPTPAYDIGSSDSWCLPWNSQSSEAEVIRVIDGVTIEVRIAGQIEMVRYIGIAMPEAPPVSAERAAIIEKNKELVAGKMVLLIKDVSESDEDGHLLRYVIAEGSFVNHELVESGYAIAESMPPDTRCDATLEEAEELARAFQRGLWAPTPTPQITRFIPSATPTPHSSGEVTITHIFYEGVHWEEANEFVEIKNTANFPIQLNDWTLNNSAGHTFIFPSFIISPGWYCRIYTNEYHPDSCGFSFYRLSQVWDNIEDCATLKDAEGNLIDIFCYD